MLGPSSPRMRILYKYLVIPDKQLSMESHQHDLRNNTNCHLSSQTQSAAKPVHTLLIGQPVAAVVSSILTIPLLSRILSIRPPPYITDLRAETTSRSKRWSPIGTNLDLN